MPEQTHSQNEPHLPVCPYLKMIWDDSLKYGYPDQANYCYRPQKPQAVLLSHQEQVCIRGPYHKCPVFAPEWEGVLPENVSGSGVEVHGKFNFGFLGSVVLCITFFIVGALKTPVVQSALWTRTSTPAVTAMMIAIQPSATPMPSPAWTKPSMAVSALPTLKATTIATHAPAALVTTPTGAALPSRPVNTPAPPEG